MLSIIPYPFPQVNVALPEEYQVSCSLTTSSSSSRLQQTFEACLVIPSPTSTCRTHTPSRAPLRQRHVLIGRKPPAANSHATHPDENVAFWWWLPTVSSPRRRAKAADNYISGMSCMSCICNMYGRSPVQSHALYTPLLPTHTPSHSYAVAATTVVGCRIEFRHVTLHPCSIQCPPAQLSVVLGRAVSTRLITITQ